MSEPEGKEKLVSKFMKIREGLAIVFTALVMLAISTLLDHKGIIYRGDSQFFFIVVLLFYLRD